MNPVYKGDENVLELEPVLIGMVYEASGDGL